MVASHLNEVEQEGTEAGSMAHRQAIPQHTEDCETATVDFEIHYYPHCTDKLPETCSCQTPFLAWLQAILLLALDPQHNLSRVEQWDTEWVNFIRYGG
jgi:hypothetical protein